MKLTSYIYNAILVQIQSSHGWYLRLSHFFCQLINLNAYIVKHCTCHPTTSTLQLRSTPVPKTQCLDQLISFIPTRLKLTPQAQESQHSKCAPQDGWSYSAIFEPHNELCGQTYDNTQVVERRS